MVTQLIQHERIQTTVAKAKELRKVADRVVTYAKKVRRGWGRERMCGTATGSWSETCYEYGLLRRRSIDLPRNRSCSAVVFEVYIGIHPCIRGDCQTVASTSCKPTLHSQPSVLQFTLPSRTLEGSLVW